MTTYLPGYLRKRFLVFFLFSIIGVLILFLVLDMVENVDKFIDTRAPVEIILIYYLYYLPYILVLTIPAATLIASVFSVGLLARNNELVATKALGYSFYQVLASLLWMGFWIGIFSFFMAEGFVSKTNQRKEVIRRQYLDKVPEMNFARLRHVVIQDPPDKIISIEYYNTAEKKAHHIKIESFQKNKLVSRIDAPSMVWNEKQWVVQNGYQRIFQEDLEKAEVLTKPVGLDLHFTPRELLQAQVKPDEMNYFELRRFVQRLKQSKGNVKRWLTDLHFRISFPMSNIFIVLLSVPLVYNLRKKSLAIGFGLGLLIGLLFFGLVKLGQTLGHNMVIHPFIAAWMGNIVAGVFGAVMIRKVRK